MAKEQANKKDVKEKKENKSFFKEFRAELKRVSWPTPKQLVNNTAIVIGIVILVAAIVFVLDVIFENLNNFGVERLKKAIVTSSSEETAEETVEESGSETPIITDVTEGEETEGSTEDTTETTEGEAVETNEDNEDSVEEN